MALTAKKISELTPIIRHLARQFEQAGKRVALDVEDLEQEAWIVARRVLARLPKNQNQYVSTSVRHHLARITCCRLPTEEINGHDVAQEDTPEPCDVLEVMVDSCLESLNDRQNRVIRLLFGIGCHRHSLREAAKVVKVSYVTVKRDMESALLKMKHQPLLIGEWQKAYLSGSD